MRLPRQNAFNTHFGFVETVLLTGKELLIRDREEHPLPIRPPVGFRSAADVKDEVRFHLETKIDDLLAQVCCSGRVR
jgi:hypothetical protein